MPCATALCWTLDSHTEKGLLRQSFFWLLFAGIIRYNNKKMQRGERI